MSVRYSRNWHPRAGWNEKKKISLSRDLCAHTRFFLRVHFQISRYNELKYLP